MKKLFLFLALSTFHLSLSTLMAQAPLAIPYQAVARDNAGNPIANHAITLRFTIHDASAGGTIVYWETQNKTTNSLGLFTANIGEGTVLGGTFAAINWGGGSKFMQVEMDASGGVTYTNMGTQQMLSVPYALSAANGNWTKNGNNITNSNVSNVGIGNNAPTFKLDVTGNGRFTSGVSGLNTIPYSAAIYGNSSAADHDYGIYGVSNTSTGIAIYGYALNGLAGYFGGKVQVDGVLNVNGNAGIGTLTPEGSAQLDVNSTTRGFLPPRMTVAQRNVISNPVAGLQIWCIDCNQLQVYDGAVWQNIGGPKAILPSVTICSQVWMSQNLNVTMYRNGDPIPEVQNTAAWVTITTGAWCNYSNITANGIVYGKLYNWYAVNDPRGLAPTGWHVPSNAEWTTLETCLGGASLAGGAMKETGTSHWLSPNVGATNSSGFTGLPGGQLVGTFENIGNWGFWWSSTEYMSFYAWDRWLTNNDGNIHLGNSNKWTALSVRCIRD